MSNTEHNEPVAIERGPAKSSWRILSAIARILLGLVFFVFGLNGFLHFIPQPKTALPEFITAMINTGYMLPLLAGTETITGALLLINRFVPFALVLIAPVIVNIVLFHIFLVPSGLSIAAIVLVLEIFLVWSYRGFYRSLFAIRATPSAG